MKKRIDKFPFFFILGIVIILVITFIILQRTPEPTYINDENPEGVIFNYILALKNSDFKKAWDYLSPTLKHYPRNAEVFSQIIRNNFSIPYIDQDYILKFGATQISENRATVNVIQTVFYSENLFYGHEYTLDFKMYLNKLNNQWKITSGEKYWLWCLDNGDDPCRSN